MEISAAAFRIAPTPPLLGRPLLDARRTTRRAAGRRHRPATCGSRALRQRSARHRPRPFGLGRAPHTIVGVMPTGFAFPVRHQLWVPLKLQTSHLRRAEGPRTRTFGRLAAGATLETAQAELTTIGARLNADTPGTAPAADSASHALPPGGMGVQGRTAPGRDPVLGQPVLHLPAGAVRRQRRHARLRAHGDATGGNHRAHGPRRQPRTDRGAALCRGARAVRHCVGRRPRSAPATASPGSSAHSSRRRK